jgi:23S rRNA pseudouridine1911/1915/1917 synthase
MPPDGGSFTLLVEAPDAGKRIDAHIAAMVPDLSRSLAADLLRRGDIRVSGEQRKPGYRLRIGDEITGRLPDPQPDVLLPEPLPLDILYEDEDLLIVNKPPDMVVHPAPGHTTGTLAGALLHHIPDLRNLAGEERRPGIVHRLDKDTSGVLAIAKHRHTQERLSAQFKARVPVKEYLALVFGEPSGSGEIDEPIGRHPVDRKRMTVRPDGRPARTRWRVLETYGEVALLHLQIDTGRTHQIRVHCAALGYPVVGDPVYGRRKPPRHRIKTVADAIKSVHRQMLHAWRLTLIHPQSRSRISVAASPPADMVRLITLLRRSAGLPHDAHLSPMESLDNP